MNHELLCVAYKVLYLFHGERIELVALTRSSTVGSRYCHYGSRVDNVCSLQLDNTTTRRQARLSCRLHDTVLFLTSRSMNTVSCVYCIQPTELQSLLRCFAVRKGLLPSAIILLCLRCRLLSHCRELRHV